MNDQRPGAGSSPSYAEHGVVPVTSWPAGNPERPRVEWAGNSGEVFDESGYSPYDDEESGPPGRQTNPPSMSGYPANVRYPTGTGSTAPPEDVYQPSQHSDDSSHPRILDKYQQVQEPTSVTIEQTKKEAEKPEAPKNSSPAQEPTESSSANIGASIVVLAIGIVLTIQ